MKKLYALILLSPMMLNGVSQPIGERIEFEEESYLELIGRGTAKPSNKKQYADLLKKVEEAKAESEAKEVEAYAILKQDELKKSAEQLAGELKSTLELIEDDEFKSLLKLDNFGIASETVETEED